MKKFWERVKAFFSNDPDWDLDLAEYAERDGFDGKPHVVTYGGGLPPTYCGEPGCVVCAAYLAEAQQHKPARKAAKKKKAAAKPTARRKVAYKKAPAKAKARKKAARKK